ncbi:MAG: TIGR02265 family protein [Deltaproteobacteria bacterium]|nr:TIGR02265 family protein [Deltaproteobacteria bacterium]
MKRACDSPGIRGGVLLSRLKFVRERGGEPALGKVLDLLPVAEREVLEGMLLAARWYPLGLNLRLDAAIATVFSPDDRARVFVEMGRASADLNLSGPQRHFVKQGDPHGLLVQAPVIYAAYYAVGHRTHEKTGPTSSVLRTFDAEFVTVTDCLTVVGWHTRAIEMCGGRDVRVVEKSCCARGADHCEYECSWR